MGSEDSVAAGGKRRPLSSSSVSCSICLDIVIFENGRSCVKLVCGHQFHLDCIGSAFNSRGTMQCPNCRNVEKGQWLYGSGGPACDDLHDEEFYDLSYSEMSFGVRWCPFMFSQLSSSFEDGEFASSAYHDLLGHHALFTEHPSVSTSHSCPYFSYYGPVHSSSQNTGPSVLDSSFSNHWSSLSGVGEVPNSYPLQAMDHNYSSWEHQSPHVPAVGNRSGNVDQTSAPPIITQRPARATSDVSRPGFYAHPFFVGHSSSTTPSNNIASSMIPPYPGAARTRDHLQALQAHFQPPTSTPPVRTPLVPGTRHSGSHRSSTQLASSSSSDQPRGFYAFPSNAPNRAFSEAEIQMPRNNYQQYYTWERDRIEAAFQPLNQVEREATRWGSYSSGTINFQQRHPSERTSSQQGR